MSHIITRVVTETGATVKLIQPDYPGGILLTIDMEQPGDGRHAEVLLDSFAALEVIQGIQMWSEM